MSFGVADMSGLNLGSFSPTQITLDTDAAGRGWYLDGTPLDDSEFGNVLSATRLQTDPTGAPAGHYDLLTTVMHEMGHALGLEDSYASADRDELMYGWLYTGERRLPGAGDADGAVAGSITERGVPRRPGRHRRAAGRQVGHHPVAGDDRRAEQPAHRQSGQPGHGHGHQRGRLPRHAHDDHRDGATTDHHHARHAEPRRSRLQRRRTRTACSTAGDSGVDGVTLSLFADANNDGVIDNEARSARDHARPPAAALYTFAGLAPGNYIVRVDQANFHAGGALNALDLQVSSPGNADPDNNVDNDDNGSRAPGAAAYSQTITLAYNTEPITPARGNDTNNHARFRLHLQHAADGRQRRAGRRRPRTSRRASRSRLSGTDADVGDAVDELHHRDARRQRAAVRRR